MNGLLSSRPTTTSPLHRVALVCALLSLVALSLFVAPASGQASRTWVSGVGDDANPCSRTAPCKTWTSAQSKTADNGEVDIIDMGDFETTTITKTMVLDGLGVYAGILTNSTGNAVVINASNTSVVVLRNLDLYGYGTGTYGISILGGKAVIIENLNINGFIGAGIHIANDATVTIIHSRISFCPTGVSTDATSNAKVSMDDVSIQLCTNGVEAAADTSFSITNSAINQNSGHGVVAHPGSHVTVAGVVLASNAVGLRAENGTTVIIHDSDFYSNTIASIECTGDPLTVYSDNRISDTLSNICAPTTPPPQVASSASRKEVAALSFLLL